ncbi:MAG: magnesium transporter CorA family protein [Phycisphaerales bacterium]|nr:magnesium transporter CorA family protein [Phycisphaerales bacterium]
MRRDYSIVEGRVDEVAGGPIRMYSAPTAEERAELLASCGIDEHTLGSMLDPEEVPRVEIDGDNTIIIWKQPDPASFRTVGLFEVSSVGMVVRKNSLTIITATEGPDLCRKRTRSVVALNNLVLRELLEEVRHYIDHLRVIMALSREVQAKLNTSIGNEYLLRMFTLGESLVYYVNAIEGNGAVLMRLRAMVDRIGFTPDDVMLLDDLMIENTQCGRQARIYSDVLSGLMDARGNIVNNNMNVLLKNLTVINVVFLPLGVLAGVGGMSEYSMVTSALPWWISYPAFLLGLTVIGFLTWRVLGRWMDRSMGHHGTKP